MAEEFNPDQFLAETAPKKPSFDPDAFLSETEGMDPPAPKPLPEPDFTGIKDYGTKNIKKALSTESDSLGQGVPSLTKAPHKGEAKTFMEALEAGFEISVSGLIGRGEAPDSVLPENAPMYHRIASQIATVAGDFPATVAGTLSGAVVGAGIGSSIAPGPGTIAGTILGGGAGGNALPTAIRESLMTAYESGSVDSFSDFWEKVSPVMIETAKQGLVGAVTMGVGSKVGQVASPLVSPMIAKSAAAASEVATMTTVGAALNGKLPEPQEFVDAAIVVGGLNGATVVAGKLRQTFAKTGYSPDQIIKESESNPGVKEDLVSTNIDTPRGFEVPGSKTEIKIDGELGKPQEGFGDEPSVIKIKKREEPELTPEPETIDPNESPILARIGADEDGKLALKERVEKTWDQFYADSIDELDPVKKLRDKVLNGEALSANDDPYVLLRNLKGTGAGTFKNFIEHGTRDFKTGKVNGKSLNQIMKPMGESQARFKEYLISKRVKELHGRGIETGFKIEDANLVVSRGAKKFEKAAQEYYAFKDRAVQYLVDSGVLSKDLAGKMREMNQSHVSFSRLMDDGKSGPQSPGSGLNVHQPIKKIKGSDRKILDPIESDIKNLMLFLDIAEKNRALQGFVKLAEKDGASDLIKKKATPSKPVRVSDKEIQKFMDDHGIDGEGEAFTIFRPQDRTLADNEIAVFVDGKRQVYEVPPEVGIAIQGLEKKQVDLVIKLLSLPAATLRAGVTSAPDFMIRNVIRDQTTAAIVSKSGYMPFLDFFSGAMSRITKDNSYYDWLYNGGGNADLVSIDADYIQKDVYDLNLKTNFMKKVRNVAFTPLEKMQLLSEITESATRIGEFKKARAKFGDRQGAFESRDLIDFAKKGAKMTAVTKMIAFLNPTIQGTVKAGTAFKDNPKRAATALFLTTTLPTILNWWANHDDERYKETPQWQRDLFWVIPSDTFGVVFRIPKPPIFGYIGGSFVERSLEKYFNEKPDAYAEFNRSMLEAFAPAYMPTVLTPVIEQKTNMNLFTNRPIIPYGKENLVPELQYSEYTSETAKILGKMVGVLPGVGESRLASPAVIDNYIRAWSGNMGQYAVQVADAGLRAAGVAKDKNKASTPLEQMPVVKAFLIRHPSTQSESIQKFYDNFKIADQAVSSLKAIKDERDPEAFKEFRDKNIDLLKVHGGMKKTKEALSNMRKAVDKIDQNKNMTPDEKRQLIDSIYFKMIEVSKAANERVSKLQNRGEDK